MRPVANLIKPSIGTHRVGTPLAIQVDWAWPKKMALHLGKRQVGLRPNEGIRPRKGGEHGLS